VGNELRIAVVICTFQRPRSLRRALESLAQCEPPQGDDWTVVVVDNFGCAETQEVAASFRGRLPVTILVEPTAGLAQARNAAVTATRCDYFIWTDDDVTVGPHWIRAYETAFERNPDTAFFGGPIVPRFEGDPPAWITACLSEIYTAFAGRDGFADRTKFDRTSGQLPFGANLAVRAAEQGQFRYDVALGRQPGRRLLGGEESDCMRRICRAGGAGLWVADARVDHWIDAKRQSVAYLWRYYTGVGFVLSRARLIKRPTQPRESRLEIRRQLVRSNVVYLWGRITRKPNIWIKALKRSAELRGELAARRALHSLHHQPSGSGK
jgi:glycosyltransferase involved in cell wall biosynthesis